MAFTAVLFAGVFSTWAAIIYFQTRHAGLTALAVGSPLPVWFLGYGIALWLDAVIVPLIAIFTCVFTIVCAQCAADRIARGVCDGLSARAAVRNALASIAMPILSVVVACGLSLLATMYLPYAVTECLAAIVLLLAALALICGGGWLARWFPYSERFITEANSARETRERWIDRLSFVCESRWALSLSGIAVVLGTIAFFGLQSLRLQGSPSLIAMRYGLVAVMTFAVLALALRNWRLAVALTLTLLFEVLFGLWTVSSGPLPVLSEDRMAFALAIAISAVPAVLLASTVNSFLRDGDDISTALSRALQQSGPGAVLACITAVVPWLIVALTGGIARFELAAALAAIAAAVLVFPALAGAIYALLPRYRSVEEVFGKR